MVQVAPCQMTKSMGPAPGTAHGAQQRSMTVLPSRRVNAGARESGVESRNKAPWNATLLGSPSDRGGPLGIGHSPPPSACGRCRPSFRAPGLHRQQKTPPRYCWLEKGRAGAHPEQPAARHSRPNSGTGVPRWQPEADASPRQCAGLWEHGGESTRRGSHQALES